MWYNNGVVGGRSPATEEAMLMVVRRVASAVALAAALTVVGAACEPGSIGGSPGPTVQRRPVKPGPPDCPPDFDLRRISNREFVCTVDGTPTIPVSARCPIGWERRSVSTQRIHPPGRQREFRTAVRWRCLSV